MNLREISEVAVLVFYMVVAVCSIVFAVIVTVNTPPRAPREHLCSIAEISPDMTQKEKEHCRLIRGHKL